MTTAAIVALILFVHVTGVVIAIVAAARAHTAQGAVAWAISLIAFPWVALPAYMFIGPHRPGELARDLAAFRARAFGRVLREMVPNASPPEGSLEPEWDVLARFAPAPHMVAPPPELLIDGTDIFDAVFGLIESAEKALVVQFYLFRDDGLGRRLREALIRRAADGVSVRVLHDGIGARNVPGAYWDGLNEAGVEVREFHVRRRLPRVLRLNYRNHRKLVAADGRTAIIGGPNVGDEYLGLDPRFGHWRDTAVKLTGPVAAAAEAQFVEDWLWAGGQPRPQRVRLPPVAGPPPTTPVLILPTGPADPLPVCSMMLLHLISSARTRLWLTTPYFVPDLDVLNVLKLAALRGVDVRVLIPDRPDHTIVWLAGFAYAEEVQRAGVKLYRYTGGFMHQKTLLVDDRVAAVGTVNFDNRSLRLNFENTVLVFDAAFAGELAAMLETDFADSILYDEAAHSARGRVIRVLGPAARLLGPLL